MCVCVCVYVALKLYLKYINDYTPYNITMYMYVCLYISIFISTLYNSNFTGFQFFSFSIVFNLSFHPLFYFSLSSDYNNFLMNIFLSHSLPLTLFLFSVKNLLPPPPP